MINPHFSLTERSGITQFSTALLNIGTGGDFIGFGGEARSIS